MGEAITQIASMIPAGALPIVICVLGLAYIYWKINEQRKATKTERDSDSEQMKTRMSLLENEVKRIRDLDLETKLAQIQTDLQWIKENLKK